MVNQYGLVCVHFIVFLCLTLSSASTNNTAKPILKRQTDSFVVSANYGVQSGNANSSVVSLHRNMGYLNSLGTILNATSQPGSRVQLVGEQELRKIEPLSTPSAWKGGNFASNWHGASFNPFQPHSVQSQFKGDLKNHSNTAQYMLQNGFSSFKTAEAQPPAANLDEIIYGSASLHTHTPITTWYKTIGGEPKAKSDELRREFVTSDTQKPSIADLQEIISKIIKGSTRVHQVVKVPAVYEIHLQEEESESPEKYRGIQDDTTNFQVPLPVPPKSQETLKPFYRPQYSRLIRHQTRTWKLPSKTNYFNQRPQQNAIVTTSPPVYGKYPYLNSLTYSAVQPTPSYYGSMNVSITPGSTSVTVWDNSPQVRPNVYGSFHRQTQIGAPDLSWYYAKKKELEREEFHSRRRFGKPTFRRNSRGESKRVNYGMQSQRRESHRMIMPFSGVNYIVHVREKSAR